MHAAHSYCLNIYIIVKHPIHHWLANMQSNVQHLLQAVRPFNSHDSACLAATPGRVAPVPACPAQSPKSRSQGPGLASCRSSGWPTPWQACRPVRTRSLHARTGKMSSFKTYKGKHCSLLSRKSVQKHLQVSKFGQMIIAEGAKKYGWPSYPTFRKVVRRL